MAVERIVVNPPIAALFGLANGTFEPQAFREQCERFATFEPRTSFDDMWRFTLNDETTLIVVVRVQPTEGAKDTGKPEYRQLRVTCAILSVCWWDTFAKSDHASESTWSTEKEEFDRCFSELIIQTTDNLGPPHIQGADEDERRHAYAIWRGQSGLLVLQQSAYDPQFGLDVNYWILPWPGSDPSPTSPFIDWLCKAS